MIGRAGLWLAWIAVLAGLSLALAAGGRLQIHSDLLALLPAPQRDPVKTAALDRLAELGQRQIIVLIGADEDATGYQAADAAATALRQNGAFIRVVARADDLLSHTQREAAESAMFSHRFHLLSPADATALGRLTNGSTADDAAAQAHFINRARARLYGLGVGSGGHFGVDPLGLADAYRQSTSVMPAPGLRLAPEGHFYVTDKTGRRYAAVFAESRQDPFTLSAQADQLAGLKAARAGAHAVAPHAPILISGVIRHAAAASARARHEVTLIGSGSLVGILLLMLWAFASLRPVLLSVAAIGGGILLAVVVTGAVFGGVHVLTLVFGASLVGVAVDYCLHLFAHRWHTPQPRRALRQILPAISLGLVTSALAYGSMGIAPFPALRQIAVFAATGLFGAWLGVILLLPAFAGDAPPAGSALRLARRWLARRPSRLSAVNDKTLLRVMGVALVVLGAVAFTTLSPDDNLRLLYNPPPDLQQDDMQVAALLGAPVSSQAIVVQGDSRQAVLNTESAIVAALRASASPVAQVTAITQAFPPEAIQERHYQALADTLYKHGGPVDQLLATIGFKPPAITAHRRAFASERGHALKFEDWLASPLSAGRQNLWLGRIGQRWASLIRIRTLDDAEALAHILADHSNTHADAQLVDRVAEISTLLGHYRHLSTGLLGGAYVLAWLLLCWPFGARGAAMVLMPPMLASVAVAVLFALFGWPFSLFNLLAMILLIGLGADYGIFLRMAQRDQAPAMLAVMLSAVTTLLAFGLLALSATPALHSFGVTLALGLTLTVILASSIGTRRQ